MSAQRTVVAILLASILIVTAATALLVVYQDASAGQEGQLTVSPDSGPAGTTVVLEGSGCNNPGQPAYLVFEDAAPETGTATVGAETVSADIPVDEDGEFRTTYTIPSEFAPGSRQGRGGGSLQPGLYQFGSRPVYCQAKFLLTSPELPRTGGGPPAQGQVGPPLWIGGVVFAAALVLFGTAGAIRRTE